MLVRVLCHARLSPVPFSPMPRAECPRAGARARAGDAPVLALALTPVFSPVPVPACELFDSGGPCASYQPAIPAAQPPARRRAAQGATSNTRTCCAASETCATPPALALMVPPPAGYNAVSVAPVLSDATSTDVADVP